MCGQRRVLVVEDSAPVRQLLARVLGDEGYVVATAAHGAAALRLLDDVRPCVILTDLRMPVLDGWAFAREYRRRPAAGAHLIGITAEFDHPRLAELGAVAILPKPFDLGALLGTVDRWVRAQRTAPDAPRR